MSESRRIPGWLLGVLGVLSCLLQTVQASPLQQRLQMADQYRFSAQSIKTLTEVQEFKQGQLSKTELYAVYSKPGKGSLAVFQSPAQAGQKVLMQGENFWIFMPKTRQPLRISPLQKLIGDASVGDLANQSWYQAYQATPAAAADLPAPLASGELALWLDASQSGVSYQRILLILAEQDNFPRRAWFYLKSGKLAKAATFERGELANRPWVVSMTFENSMLAGSKTVMKLTSANVLALDDKIFNPAFLVRNNVEE